MKLQPFWRYYGGKFRAAPWYPAPEHETIVEPFAGAAGYACRYPDRNVLLIDANPIVCSVWRYLIAATAEEILRLPDIPAGGTVDDMNVCQEARWLAGFWCGNGKEAPGKRPSTYAKIQMHKGYVGGWTLKTRRRISRQVQSIRHWRVMEGDYTCAPDIDATWFVDPPYNNRAGSYYSQQPRCFDALGSWCKERAGLTIVCENKGATWLPFQDLRNLHNRKGGGSQEVIWLNKSPKYWRGVQGVLF